MAQGAGGSPLTAESWFPADPQRGTLTRVSDGTSYEFLFNPTELEHSIKVSYSRTAVPGMGAPITQFSHTDAETFSFELFINAEKNPNQIPTVMRFLQSLCRPRKSQDMRGSAPSQVLFVWPSLYSMHVVIDSVTFNHLRFAATGQPTATKFKLALSSVTDMRLWAEDAFADQGADAGVPFSFSDYTSS